jgi:hypothetical protein
MHEKYREIGKTQEDIGRYGMGNTGRAGIKRYKEIRNGESMEDTERLMENTVPKKPRKIWEGYGMADIGKF